MERRHASGREIPRSSSRRDPGPFNRDVPEKVCQEIGKISRVLDARRRGSDRGPGSPSNRRRSGRHRRSAAVAEGVRPTRRRACAGRGGGGRWAPRRWCVGPGRRRPQPTSVVVSRRQSSSVVVSRQSSSVVVSRCQSSWSWTIGDRPPGPLLTSTVTTGVLGPRRNSALDASIGTSKVTMPSSWSPGCNTSSARSDVYGT